MAEIIMHLAIEAVAAKNGGAATVLVDFLQAAVKDDRISKISVFCAPAAVRNFPLNWSSKLEPIEMPHIERSRLARWAWSMKGFGQRTRELGADACICMSGQGQTIPPMPNVTFVQQSLPFSPEGLAALSRRRRLEMHFIRQLMKRSCQAAQHVIVQTPTMANWVSHSFAIDARKIYVAIPTASLPNADPGDAVELAPMRATGPGARLLYVGLSSSKYKMLATIVAGMRLLRETHPQATLFLTLAPSSPYARAPGVVCLGSLQRELLQPAYSLATAVVLPSLVETVGLPMIEAMSVGTPVIAADRPYAHDVCADAAIYFDPHDARDFAAKTARVLQDDQLRADLRAKGSELTHRRQQAAPYRRMVDIVVSAAHGTPIPKEQTI